MQTTETVLKVYKSRGEKGQTLQGLYRQLFKSELYEMAYSQIYANLGATTSGTSEDTLDGMSEERIDKIIQKVKTETYRWNPVRRTYIPKADGRKRPLGIPSGDDKILQAAMKILLEAFYEPQFSEHSHGFRSGRGCHTALRHIGQKHRDVAWFIEGDIKGCFENIDHKILMEILGEKIKDGRMLKLISNLLKAGYMEDWTKHDTLSGTPQGGIVSPLLTNIYMDVFDKWVENELLPRYNRSLGKLHGKASGRRRVNPAYIKLRNQRRKAWEMGDREAVRQIDKIRKNVPSVRPNDEGYRKLAYCRYADDFILSFAGPKSEAVEIKEEIRTFLKEKLNLELSKGKTLITHARTQKARFLGYDLRITHSSERRTANGSMWYGVPYEVIAKNVKKYTQKGKPAHRSELILNSDYDIVTKYQSEYRGLVQYYIMAHNIIKLRKVNWATQASLTRTLAAKHKISVKKVFKRYGATTVVNGSTYKVLEVTVEREGKKSLRTYYGGIPLTRNPRPQQIKDVDLRYYSLMTTRSELVARLQADECEMCGEKGKVEVHHVRKLKDVNTPGRRKKPIWVHRMAAIRRKTLMTCQKCHRAIHTGQHLKEWDSYKDTLESRVQ